MLPGPATCRPWSAAAAAGALVLGVALALRGYARTPPPAGQAGRVGEGSGPLLGPRVRAWYAGVLAPFARLLVARAVPADLLTYLQLAVSAAAGAAFAAGAVFLAGWLVIGTGTLDVLDGQVARRSGGASPRGAFVDSVVDRYAEFMIYLGLGVLFRASWVVLLVVFALFGSLMVSYTRARAEGLGLAMHEGAAQRPERTVLLGFGAAASGLAVHLGCAFGAHPGHAVLALTVGALAVLSMLTAIERARLSARRLGTPGEGIDAGLAAQGSGGLAANPEEGAGAPSGTPGGLCRAGGFALLLVGFGLRLGTTFAGTALALVICGGAIALAGLARAETRS